MKTKTFTLLVALLIATLGFSQQKYAMIINAYAPETDDSENSWALANPTDELLYEFWNDVYLMWEMLYERGFKDENIFVCFNYGKDYPVNNPWYNERYTAAKHDLTQITDYRAYNSAVDSVLTGLAHGSLGFPQIQEDDFFVLYTFGHGHIELEETGQAAFLVLYPGYEMPDTYFATLTEQINCDKKVLHNIPFYKLMAAENLPF
jgi:hypothetical protein